MTMNGHGLQIIHTTIIVAAHHIIMKMNITMMSIIMMTTIMMTIITQGIATIAMTILVILTIMDIVVPLNSIYWHLTLD
ncbi:MAG: hypothetical protein C0596_17010 [Marinilabiliales bacterium]|nr:MAG: hypothetical protein C0596_17010 [Marinilabiliales bacterium]